MRCLVGFVFVLALGVMGCSETAGTGGSGGDGGEGGAACVDNVCPCTEAGMDAALAAGGGPYTFACDGPTALAESFKIDNDVILDGEGQLIVISFGVAGGVTAELRAFEMTYQQSVWPIEWGGWGIRNDGTLTITDSSMHGLPWTGISNVGTLELFNSSVSGNFWRGIRNRGTLTIADSIISGNSTGDLGGGGAGIFNSGTLTIANSTISENFARHGDLYGGGGIYNSGSASIFASTVSRNEDTSEHEGGAIQNDGGLVTVTNSTISENAAAGPGGGILNSGILMIINSTVSGNTATSGGGGIFNGDTATLTNTVIDGDCWGDITSNGYNIESPGNTCGFDEAKGDQFNVTEEDLKLGPLQDNGGPTETHALGVGSVAINHIPVLDCRVETDQRGAPRPVELGCDVGAFEWCDRVLFEWCP